jgi:hypothetical protein
MFALLSMMALVYSYKIHNCDVDDEFNPFETWGPDNKYASITCKQWNKTIYFQGHFHYYINQNCQDGPLIYMTKESIPIQREEIRCIGFKI